MNADIKVGDWLYLIIPFGWVMVGQLAKIESDVDWRLISARFVTNAGTDHGTASHAGIKKSGSVTNPVGARGLGLVNPMTCLWKTDTPAPWWASEAEETENAG